MIGKGVNDVMYTRSFQIVAHIGFQLLVLTLLH